MWYNTKILKDIIMYWHPEYEDVQIRGLSVNGIPDMVMVRFIYKSEFLIIKTVDNFCYFPITINVHKRDIRDYRISKILSEELK